MLAPFATLAFLVVLWASALVIAKILVRSRSRMIAALRGETPLAGTALSVKTPARRAGYPRRQPLRAQPQLRAAA